MCKPRKHDLMALKILVSDPLATAEQHRIAPSMKRSSECPRLSSCQLQTSEMLSAMRNVSRNECAGRHNDECTALQFGGSML